MSKFEIIRVPDEIKDYVQEISKRRSRNLMRRYLEWEVVQEMVSTHKKQEGLIK